MFRYVQTSETSVEEKNREYSWVRDLPGYSAASFEHDTYVVCKMWGDSSAAGKEQRLEYSGKVGMYT